MAWRMKDVSEKRLEFVIRAGSGKEEMSGLCLEFGISRPTGYKWVERYRECERLEELKEKSRRPLKSPLKTSPESEAAVVALRQRYPDWGAKKLEVLLQREGIEIPRITIHRILLRNGLVREQDRHRHAVKRYERKAPNELWQMDFKGMPEERKGCIPLTILDDHSRYLVGLFALGGTRAEEVQKSLELVFARSGMPEAMLMDHGTPWWTMQSETGWTCLTVWLMKHGVRIYMSGYRHPQTQGKVERNHGSMELAMWKRPKGADQSWQDWLDAYRWDHNEVRPHESLNMDVPAQHWRRSERSYRPDPPEWEYSNPQRVRRVAANGGIQVEGKRYFISRALIGEAVEVRQWDARALVYYCRTPLQELDLQTGARYPVDYGQLAKLRAQGILQ